VQVDPNPGHPENGVRTELIATGQRAFNEAKSMLKESVG
jgi:hypothetical protein